MGLRTSVVLLFVLAAVFGAVAFAQQVAPKATTGSVVGTVVDSQGRLVRLAQVTLTPEVEVEGVPSMPMVVKTDAEGEFKFVGVPAGRFVLGVTASGFQAGTVEGQLLAGQYDELGAVVLGVGGTATDVEVHPLTQVELAEQEVKAEEQQKVFGVVPNFFVAYKEHPTPLNARQKMELSLRATVDPFAFLSTAVVAGIQQADDVLPGYNQGVEGYAKRYGAAYTFFASATMLRHGVYPALFRQDPRYFYRGTGSVKSRVLYALSTGLICKGDNGKNEVNYSSILGNLSAGALTNLYYPAGSNNGLSTTLENGALGIVGVGVAHVFQEFLFDKITRRKAGQ